MCFLGDFFTLYHGKSPLNHPFGRIFFHFFQASNKQIPVPCVTTYFAKVTTNSFNPSFVLSKNQAVKFPWGWGMNNHSDVFLTDCNPIVFVDRLHALPPQKEKKIWKLFGKTITQRRLCKITFPFDGLIFWFEFHADCDLKLNSPTESKLYMQKKSLRGRFSS